MRIKKLLEYNFEFVDDIAINKNRDGTIQEYQPELSYNSENAELHKYGKGPFCRFSIHPKWCVSGVYALYIADELVYIGQALDLAKRWNNGYGNISARACWSNGNSGGQPTNCKINKIVLVASKEDKFIKLYFYKTANYHIIEKTLIEYFHPIYNVSLNREVLKENYKMTCLSSIENDHTSGNKIGVEEIRKYIKNIFKTEKEKSSTEVVLVSGNIHNALNLISRMPSVCDAMYSLMKTIDKVIYAPPKGKGSKLKIIYYL